MVFMLFLCCLCLVYPVTVFETVRCMACRLLMPELEKAADALARDKSMLVAQCHWRVLVEILGTPS